MRIKSLFQTLLLGLLALSLVACATATKENPDPYMNYNEGAFRFNQDINRAFLKPITDAYRDVAPALVRQSVTNFFDNLETVPHIINDLLQFNFRYFFSDCGRLLMNTIFGIGGLLDPAHHAGLYAHQQGFGYTLYKWGLMRHSPYFIIPFLGPSTVRGTIGIVPDYLMHPISYVKMKPWQRYSLIGLYTIQKAANDLPKLHFITENALNPYIAVRNAYLQNQKMVLREIMSDGTAPANNDDQERQTVVPSDRYSQMASQAGASPKQIQQMTAHPKKFETTSGTAKTTSGTVLVASDNTTVTSSDSVSTSSSGSIPAKAVAHS